MAKSLPAIRRMHVTKETIAAHHVMQDSKCHFQ